MCPQTRDGEQWRIDIALDEVATNTDVLVAHLHGVIAQNKLESASGSITDAWAVVEEAYSESLKTRVGFLAKLNASDWTTATLLVEERSSRYKWLSHGEVEHLAN